MSTTTTSPALMSVVCMHICKFDCRNENDAAKKEKSFRNHPRNQAKPARGKDFVTTRSVVILGSISESKKKSTKKVLTHRNKIPSKDMVRGRFWPSSGSRRDNNFKECGGKFIELSSWAVRWVQQQTRWRRSTEVWADTDGLLRGVVGVRMRCEK